MPPVEIANTLSPPPRPFAICGPAGPRPRPPWPPNPPTPPPGAGGTVPDGGAPARPGASAAAPAARPPAPPGGLAPAPGPAPRFGPPRPAGAVSGVAFVRTGRPDAHAARRGVDVASF